MKDSKEFKERFAGWKKGELVYENGRPLPRYQDGKSPIDTFVEQLGPSLYRSIIDRGIENPDVVYNNAMRQLAAESQYGTSRVARENRNYGGIGWNGSTYYKYNTDLEFIDDYLSLLQHRYPKALAAKTPREWAHELKVRGYYEAPEAVYANNMSNMKSLLTAMDKHWQSNANLYTDTPFKPTPVQLPKLGRYWSDMSRALLLTSDPRELYDYVGYLLKYGTLNPSDSNTGHYTDEFKLPGHPTFSVESKYSNALHPGGVWSADGTKFEHSDFTMNHPTETYQYLKQNDPNVIATYKGGAVLPEVVVYGTDRRNSSTMPSVLDTLTNPYYYNMLKDWGLIDDDDDISSYAFYDMLGKGRVFPKFSGGKGTETVKALALGGIGLIPIVGSVQDGMEFAKNPSWENLGYFGASVLGDVLFFTGAGAGVGAAIKAAKVANRSRKAVLAIRNTNHVARYSAALAKAARDLDAAKALIGNQFKYNILPEAMQTTNKIKQIHAE